MAIHGYIAANAPRHWPSLPTGNRVPAWLGVGYERYSKPEFPKNAPLTLDGSMHWAVPQPCSVRVIPSRAGWCRQADESASRQRWRTLCQAECGTTRASDHRRSSQYGSGLLHDTQHSSASMRTRRWEKILPRRRNFLMLCSRKSS